MALTAEMVADLKEALPELIGQPVNAAIKSQLDTQTKRFEKQLRESSESIAKMLDEKLTTVKPPEGKEPPEGKGKKDVELESIRRQMSEQATAHSALLQKLKEAEDQNRTTALHTLVTERLSALGQIVGTGARLALNHLSAIGRVGYDEDGDSPNRAVFRGEDGVTVDLDTGLKTWLKTDEAKFFQAPSGTRGSGSRPAQQPATSGPVTRDGALGNAMGYLAKALQSEFRGVDTVDED